MSTTATNVDVSTNEWMRKMHFDNRVDINLQLTAAGESNKIQVDEIPPVYLSHMESNKKQQPKQSLNTKTSDSYLNSILSSSAKSAKTTKTSTTITTSGCNGATDCGCYKCQRQRRRNGRTATVTATAASSITPTQPTTNETVQHAAAVTTATTYTARSNPPPSKRSLSLRKAPTVKSYDKHMPRPTYSENESIYRINKPEQEHHANREASWSNSQQQADDYQISWKDDSTGDDLLGSLKAFQTIFAEQPEDNSGLSDLIERKAQELKVQRTIEAQRPSEPTSERKNEQISRRNGPPHRALTLYHTMKMRGPSERMAAYALAYDHCIQANSGLATWIHKRQSRGPPSILHEYTPHTARRPINTKKSMLHPLLLPSKKQKHSIETMWQNGGLPPNRPRSASTSPSVDSSSSPAVTPTDVLSAAHALLPSQSPMALNESLSRTDVDSKPYDYVDTPAKPIPQPKGQQRLERRASASSSVASSDADKRSKLFSSLGRKSRSGTNASLRSVERSESVKKKKTPEQALDDLCDLMPHIDRQVLQRYLHDAGGDYLTALQLCKQAVAAGEL